MGNKRSSLTSCLLLAVVVVAVFFWSGRVLHAEKLPDQPINFSHKLHAGDNEIPCLYCHSYARRSIMAGIPAVRKCMGCHKITAADRPEIKKLKQFWDSKEPIPWVRIFKAPDHVYFNHRRHVLKEVQCQECHGPVETMEEIKKYSSMKMGWCLKCHKKRQADIDCFTCHR